MSEELGSLVFSYVSVKVLLVFFVLVLYFLFCGGVFVWCFILFLFSLFLMLWLFKLFCKAYKFEFGSIKCKSLGVFILFLFCIVFFTLSNGWFLICVESCGFCYFCFLVLLELFVFLFF